jgi:NADH-quinone oxidoreductase subunit C
MADDSDNKGPERPKGPEKPAAPPSPPPKKEAAPDPLKREVPCVALDRLRESVGDAVEEVAFHADQASVRIPSERLLEVARFLRDDEASRCDLLVDLCAADYPDRDQRFEICYHLYSIPHGHFLRLKVSAAEDESVPSVVDVWSTADWFEREAFDLFGVPFEGHPDLRRILLPDHWRGHPLRKEYPLAGFPDLHLKLR